MTCFHPISCWQHKTRKSNTGKSIVVFGAPPADLSNYRSIQVPCGQCIGCRLDYSRSWALRCYHELKMHKDNCFITLTYDDLHVPWSSITGEQTLHSKDLCDFWKRLRKHFPDKKIRYFACGEYGDETNRPHYHALLFGFDFADKQLFKRSAAGFDYYVSPTLSEIWKNGQCTVCNANFDTAAYVARYVVKKLNGPLGVEKYEGIEKEFCRMSRRPGIGYEWFQKYHSDIYPYDMAIYECNGRMRIAKPSRYYDNLFDIDYPDVMKAVRDKRLVLAERHAEENSVAGRMLQREAFKNEQIKRLKRSVEL